MTDGSLKFGADEVISELPWRRVTVIKTAANCWIISIRGAQMALVIPQRAIPAGSDAEVAEFFRQRNPALGRSAAPG